MVLKLTKKQYSELYGVTTGDKIRLAILIFLLKLKRIC